ncbi:hypothetical protein [Legionella cardiaca]|uniref:Ankyrin repeats (3 copies) n=1 Tax=Legionella cardiaca TaxID=1071983 RepID=A0ABY8AX91_9GAMM|nr:hypothetical protein [Legionella cardiaca]WED44341.1 hypothetical protein PXX05_06020 [Legionella cardiaca]
MKVSELLKKMALKSVYLDDNLWKKHTGLTAIVLAFTPLEDKNEDEEVDNETLNCLIMASRLDNKNINNLSRQSISILKKVNKLLSREEQTYIATLDDAIKVISDNKFNLVSESVKKHVVHVFSAISQISKSQQDIPGSVFPIDILDSGETYRFYFHGENYPDYAARRATLERLNIALINIWNDAIENKQLAFFLENIQAGPCIEGATREAMAKVVGAIEKRILPTDFDTAMAMYFAQAAALLARLNLPQSLMNIHDLILQIHGGERCTPKLNTPEVITSNTIRSYLKTLGYYDFLYRVDIDEAHRCRDKLADKLKSYSIAERLSILQTISTFAPAEVCASLQPSIYSYKELGRLTEKKDLTSTEVNSLLGILLATNSFNTPLFKTSVLETAWNNRSTLVIEALLECPELDFAQIEKNTSLNLCTLISAKEADQKYLIQLLQAVPAFANRFSWEMLKNSIANFFLYPSGPEALRALISANPQIVKTMTADSLLTVVPYLREYVPIYILLFMNMDVMKTVLELNPLLIENIPIEMFFEIPRTSTVSVPRLLYRFFLNDGHADVLLNMLQIRPELAKHVTAEMLAKFGNVYGPDVYPKSVLGQAMKPNNHKNAQVLFKILRLNPEISKQITKEMLCNSYPDGGSLLFELVADIASFVILDLLFRQNKMLEQYITAEALFRQNTGLYPEFTPFHLMAANPAGHPLLLGLLAKRPDLIDFITEKTLSMIPKASKTQKSPKTSLSETKEGAEILKLINIKFSQEKSKESTREKEELNPADVKRYKTEQSIAAPTSIANNPHTLYPSDIKKRRNPEPAVEKPDIAVSEILKFSKTEEFDDKPDDSKINGGKKL